jgi:hypothetical protein
MVIKSLAKPAGSWCPHAVKGGCGVHGSHPDDCRSFRCRWLYDRALDEAWRPNRAKFVVSISTSGRRTSINLDASQPLAWRRGPYYEQIKLWSRAAWTGQGQVLLYLGDSVTAVFPEEELQIGVVGPDEQAGFAYRFTETTRQPCASILAPDGSEREFLGRQWPRGKDGGP